MEKEFDYSQAILEEVKCNLCGEDDFFVLAKRSADGLAVRTCLCKRCGLIYLNPRMTKSGYDVYYKYFYRVHRSAVKKEERPSDELAVNFASGRRFGSALALKLKHHINQSGLTIDVGSSTGGVLSGLKEIFPAIEPLGVEPSLSESDFAERRGIRTVRALFEDFANHGHHFGGPPANIFCVRSLNHLLDPKKFFIWAHEQFRPGGRLILEVKNFRHQARRAGSVASGVQIDHPYMFTPETLKSFVESAGFRVAFIESDEYKSRTQALADRYSGLSIHHLRLSAEKPAGSEHYSYRASINPAFPKLLKSQLSPLALKAYYLIHYHRGFGALRKLPGFRVRN